MLYLLKYVQYQVVCNVSTLIVANGPAISNNFLWIQHSYAMFIIKLNSLLLQGKGVQKTYWLVGKAGWDRKLPPLDPYIWRVFEILGWQYKLEVKKTVNIHVTGSWENV